MSVRLIPSAADRRLLDESKGSRSMLWIMAIMLFLTVLSAALGLGTLAAARLLDRQISGRLTVQIVVPGDRARDDQAKAAVATLRTLPEVKRVAEVDRVALGALLRPWLGADGADPDLPVPAMIDVDLAIGTDAAVARVTQRLKAVAPGARVDRHESWMSPISNFMGLLTALAAGLVLLMAGATAAVVILAARAGLETHRETIGVLHMLGSTDVQVARLFQRRIALDTLFGGVLGTIFALLTVAAIGAQLSTLGSDLLNGLALGSQGWVVLLLLPVAFAVLATFAARLAVLGALRRIL